MHQIAPDVFQIPLMPRNGMNAYLLGDVLVDTGIPVSAKKITEAVKGRAVQAIALTHAHPDHAGSARRIADELGVPVWAGAADRAAAEQGRTVKKPALDKPVLGQVVDTMGKYPAVPVARELREGDELTAGFTVLDTPGHSPGHMSFWREADGTLICGDVFFNMHILTTVPGLRQPPAPLTPDPALNRDSERKLAKLEPSVVGFGHGPVLADGTAAKMSAFVASLP